MYVLQVNLLKLSEDKLKSEFVVLCQKTQSHVLSVALFYKQPSNVNKL